MHNNMFKPMLSMFSATNCITTWLFALKNLNFGHFAGGSNLGRHPFPILVDLYFYTHNCKFKIRCCMPVKHFLLQRCPCLHIASSVVAKILYNNLKSQIYLQPIRIGIKLPSTCVNGAWMSVKEAWKTIFMRKRPFSSVNDHFSKIAQNKPRFENKKTLDHVET